MSTYTAMVVASLLAGDSIPVEGLRGRAGVPAAGRDGPRADRAGRPPDTATRRVAHERRPDG